MALSLFFGIRTLNKKHSLDSSLFILSLCLFSHIRYENPLIAAILGGFVLMNTKEKKKFLLRWEFALIFGSISLHLWQRILTPSMLKQPGTQALFSIGNLIENLKNMAGSLIQDNVPFNPVFTILFFPAALVLLIHPQFLKIRSTSILLLLSIIIPTLFNLTALGGIYSHPASMRYYFPLAIGSSLLVPWVFSKLFNFKINHLAILAGTNWILFSISPTHYDYINTLELNRDLHQLYDFVEKQNSKRILVIYDRPVQLTSIGYGGITFERAKRELRSIHEELNNGLYDHVFAFESSTYTLQETRWTVPEHGFKEIRHFQQHGDSVMFISELDKNFKIESLLLNNQSNDFNEVNQDK